MIMPSLLLQKPFLKSKMRHHSQCLKRRLALWEEGNLNELIREGRAIQQSSSTRSTTTQNIDSARRFAQMMHEGNVKSALRMTSTQDKGMPMNVSDSIGDNETVFDVLCQKHPEKKPLIPSAITNDSTINFHSVIFEEITGDFIRNIVLRTQGSAGPSGLDAKQWKHLCTSFQSASDSLCDAIAKLSVRLCSSIINPDGISALTACRLIALNKSPGVRPIGVGEVLRRIVCKAALRITREDVRKAVGPLQLGVGYDGGCEAAVHAMSIMSSESEATLLVNATNAFNNLNRNNTLVNISRLCPSLANIVINTYRQDTSLHIQGKTVMSQEGTVQGDPLSTCIYAIGLRPLIDRINHQDTKQLWYVDDAAATGTLDALYEWWSKLINEGPKFGYLPNPQKTWLVTDESLSAKASEIFKDSGIQVTSEGRPYLGSAIGSDTYTHDYIADHVRKWNMELNTLATFGRSQPHAAYSAFIHGFSSKWSFLMRTTDCDCHLYHPLEDTIIK